MLSGTWKVSYSWLLSLHFLIKNKNENDGDFQKTLCLQVAKLAITNFNNGGGVQTKFNNKSSFAKAWTNTAEKRRKIAKKPYKMSEDVLVIYDRQTQSVLWAIAQLKSETLLKIVTKCQINYLQHGFAPLNDQY